ncbi:DUF4302 domain-containing protein [Sphingobacterium paludis]|uniref:Uncharacterized protein DUF4302 n=1 Tax=Sphingobacterium paludis TaxID=1476465 RepID=A0A4R7CWM1_9SPHI|nr:DUF4302 domain-containing protein [Sphingobacterium paludis]TDS08911.1 uncharacterized protein DUF4302 [Sphingobacterium paludis]
MKIKKAICFLAIPVLLLHSCKRETDRVFEENATIRLKDAIENAYSVLMENKVGWMMKVYPGLNQEFGGYTVFTKFISNAQVSIASDPFDGIQTSDYAVIQESGPVLTFNGFNKNIHWFSEPGKDNGGIGADDTGMRGDFEFIVLTASADSIVLKGRQSKSKVIMLPLKDKNFESVATEYRDAARQFSKLRVLKLEGKDGKTQSLIYNPKMRVFQNPKDNSGQLLSFRITPIGLEFQKPYEIEGVTVDFLTFNQPAPNYPNGYYSDDERTFKIF